MFHIVLYQPEIPPNTGNIIRLCANTGAQLHLIHPLGFSLEDKQLRRAGLDYHEWATIQHYESYQEFKTQLNHHHILRLFACTTKAQQIYSDVNYKSGDAFLLGPETSGLPQELLNTFSHNQKLRIPMLPVSRSLNLANSTAIVLYEAWRQCQFEGLLSNAATACCGDNPRSTT